MKHTVAKTFRTIFIVLAVILLVITALLYFIDTPVVEEGQEPTVAQKLVLLGKKHLGEILAVCGVSGIGLLGVLTKLIYNSVKKMSTQSQTTSADVSRLEERLKMSEKENAELKEQTARMEKKQDIANNMLMTVFSLSELPASLREKIHAAQAEYNGLDGVIKVAEQIVESVKNAEEAKEQPVRATDAPVAEQEHKAKAEEEKPSSPVYV